MTRHRVQDHSTPARAPNLLAGAFLLSAAMVIATGAMASRAAFDHKLYHWPVIEQFAREWPHFDVWDYLSATTPGYHMLMATLVRMGMGIVGLLCVAACIAATLLWIVTRDCEKHSGALRAITLCAPLALSPYVFYPGVSLLPDDLGWLGVVLMLLLALRTPTLTTLLAGCVTLAALVLVRQSHAWTGGLLVVSAWLGSAGMDRAVSARARRVLLACVCVAPAAILLVLFVRYWGGLVPPRMQTWYTPRSADEVLFSSAPVMFLASLGLYGIFFALFARNALRSAWTRHRVVLILCSIIGVALSLWSATTDDYDAGRRGGVWWLGAHGPVLFGRTSLIVVALSAWGATLLGALLISAPRRDRWIFLAAACGFVASQLPSTEFWQRYYDPFVLVLLAMLCARTATSTQDAPPGWRFAQPASLVALALLAVLFAGWTVRGLYGPSGVKLSDPPPPTRDLVNHRGKTPPVELPVTPKPEGKRFWTW